MKKLKLFINNKWVNAEDGKTFLSSCPATGEKLAELPLASAKDVDNAVRSARVAFPKWSAMSGDERANLMMKALEIIKKRNDEFAEWEAKDVGKPINEAMTIDMPYVYMAMEYFSNKARQIRGFEVPISGGDTLCYETWEPYGVVGCIIPWNFPLHIATRTICPAISAGNTVVLKASSLAPITCQMLGEIFFEAGYPEGVLNIVSGSGSITGEAMLNHPGIDMISFTGSTSVGRRCLRASADSNIKKVILELGGKGPFIAESDCKISEAVNSLIIGFCVMQGEVCCASTRLYAHEDIYDEFVNLLVKRINSIKIGDIMDPETKMGSLIDENQLNTVDNYIKRAVNQGAKLLCGGKRIMDPPLDKGFFYTPTVLEVKDNRIECVQEEIFGPVCTVMKYKSFDEALKMANDNIYALGATIWSENVRKLIKAARTLNAGIVWMNTNVRSKIEASYGGNKMSGIGREGGEVGLMEYLKCKNNVLLLGDEGNYYGFKE